MIARSDWSAAESNPDIYIGHTHSGHSIRIDTSSQHTEGPSPMELVLTALCGCTSVDVVHILKKKRQPLASLTVSAEAEQRKEYPTYFTRIRLTYTVRGQNGQPLSRKAVEDAVDLSRNKYCSVSAMLEKSAEIDFVIDYNDVEPLP